MNRTGHELEEILTNEKEHQFIGSFTPLLDFQFYFHFEATFRAKTGFLLTEEGKSPSRSSYNVNEAGIPVHYTF